VHCRRENPQGGASFRSSCGRVVRLFDVISGPRIAAPPRMAGTGCMESHSADWRRRCGHISLRTRPSRSAGISEQQLQDGLLSVRLQRRPEQVIVPRGRKLLAKKFGMPRCCRSASGVLKLRRRLDSHFADLDRKATCRLGGPRATCCMRADH